MWFIILFIWNHEAKHREGLVVDTSTIILEVAIGLEQASSDQARLWVDHYSGQIGPGIMEFKYEKSNYRFWSDLPLTKSNLHRGLVGFNPK